MKITDTERLDAVIGGLVFWRTKYNKAWGAHFAEKHGYKSGADKCANTYFGECAREVIDAAIRNKPIKHCACCNAVAIRAQRRGKK